jgi:hypothetical protein
LDTLPAEVVEELRGYQLRWELSDDELARLLHRGSVLAAGALLTVCRALDAFYPDEPVKQREWWARPNAALEGRPPLGLALASEDELQWLAYCLDSALTVGKPGGASRRGG